MYAALRDAEAALALCPSYQKALRRRLQCLQHLNWNKPANHLLKSYTELYPNDNDFISRTQDNLDLALKSESGRDTSSTVLVSFKRNIMCVCVCVCAVSYTHLTLPTNREV